MLHALTAPAGKTVALAALVLAFAIAARSPERAHGRHLVLHAEARPNATYLTVFQDNQLWMKDARALTTLVFTTHGNVSATCKTTDEAPACHWVGTERLVPIDEHSYSYSYTEELLDCDPGAVQACIDTPRTGTVTIEDN